MEEIVQKNKNRKQKRPPESKAERHNKSNFICSLVLIFNMMNHSKFLLSLALAWIGPTKDKGTNFHPSALKNLFWIYTHCRRRA